MDMVLLPTNADVSLLRTHLTTAFVLFVDANRALYRGGILLASGGNVRRAEELAFFAFVLARSWSCHCLGRCDKREDAVDGVVKEVMSVCLSLDSACAERVDAGDVRVLREWVGGVLHWRLST